MKISHKWLKNYIDLEAEPEEVKEKLTMLGLEVESVDYPGEKFKNFYVGFSSRGISLSLSNNV